MVTRARRALEWLSSHGPLVGGLLVGAGALALYARTLLPGVGFWDTAEFQTVGPVLGIAHPTGYPSYTLLSWLASVVLQPFGDPALRANLLSALLAAGTAGLAAGVVARLTGVPVVGVAAGVGVAVAPTAWAVGLRADAHALHFFLGALLLALLVGWWRRMVSGDDRADRWLVAAAVTYGVSLGNHALTILLAPGIAAFVLLVEPRILSRQFRLVAVCAVALAATTVALYAYLPLRSAMNPPLDYANPQTWEGFRYLVFAEQFRGTFHDYPAADTALRTVAAETWRQLGPLALLAIVGFVAALVRRPPLAALLGLWFAVTWAFALGYVNADIDRYHLLPTLSAAVLGGVGAGEVWRLVAARLGAGDGREPGGARRNARVAGVVIGGALLLVPSLATVPQRFDEVDQSTDAGSREFVDALLGRVEPDAVIVSWWSYSTPLWYARFVEGRRPDVEVIDDRTVLDRGLGDAGAVVDANLDRRPVYVIRLAHDLPELEARFVLQPLDGIPTTAVYRVTGRR